METLYDEPYFYTVSRDEKTYEYFLDVTCGRTAIFNVQVKLSKEEIEQFLKDSQALNMLALRVIDAPEKFSKRGEPS